MKSAMKKFLFYGSLLLSLSLIGIAAFSHANNDNYNQIIKCCTNCGEVCSNNNEIAMCCHNCTMPIIASNTIDIDIVNKQINEMGWKREGYPYYLQDMALERVILSKIFNHLAPGSFPEIKFNISYDRDNKRHILETKSRDINFVSMLEYGYENGRKEGESDEALINRINILNKDFRKKLSGMEKLYAIATYLGMPIQSWNSWDVGFSRDTWQAMMVYNDTFHSTFSELDEKKLDVDSMSEPFEYKFDKEKYCLALQKIKHLSDNEIEGLIDETFSEAVSQYGFSYFESEGYKLYKAKTKELLKKNKKIIINFLDKKTECLATDKK